MNAKLYLSVSCSLYVAAFVYAQESALRPRVQLAQAKNDLDGLLASLNVSTVPQGHQAIKQLHTRIETLERKNQQLSDALESKSTQQKDLKETSKKLAHAQTQIEKLKTQIRTHHERLKKVLDRLAQDME